MKQGLLQSRQFPIGAEVSAEGASFRLWAPDRHRVEVFFASGERSELAAEADGYFSGLVTGVKEGARYGFSLDGAKPLPDPASRFQPDGPHALSELISPKKFKWSDEAWSGIDTNDAVIYEGHIGTFTEEGNWDSATARLPDLADLGITVVELMPVAEFAGRFGWGYDGVSLFAPAHIYGRPDAMRRFVDSAHKLGIAVIVDVVYNHFGPDGCYLQEFSESYFSQRHNTEWGRGINFDGKFNGPVREFFLTNARYWISEFHLDGLRLDATQSIVDSSQEHILAAVAVASQESGGKRRIYLVAENERQEPKMVRSLDQDGFGLSALWNDDLHHTAIVALTGRTEAYYTDYKGSPQEFISAAKYGYLYQGQRYDWQKHRRGSPSIDLPPGAFVNYLENHDQTANSAHGLRLHQITSAGLHRALTTYLLLAPQSPMLFQGQEFNSSRPFLYFADHVPDLAKLVRQGRVEFLAQFPSIRDSRIQEELADPGAEDTFKSCKLQWEEKNDQTQIYSLHRSLIALRRDDPVISGKTRSAFDGAVLSDQCFLLRYFDERGSDRLLIVNLGRQLRLSPAPEPLLAPPQKRRWACIFSTENPRYGGFGEYPLEGSFNWRIPAQSAVVMSSIAHQRQRNSDDVQSS